MTNNPFAAPFKILRRIDHGNEEPCSCNTLLKLPNFINSFFLCENATTREEGKREREEKRGKERKREGKRGKEREREGKRGKERKREEKGGKGREREGKRGKRREGKIERGEDER